MSKWPFIALLGVALFALALDFGERANLVDPIPLAITFASGASFFGAGVWFTSRMKIPAYMGPLRSVLARIAMPFFFAVVGTFLARVAVETMAFVGLNPLDVPIQATVVGTSDRWGPSAFVSLGGGTRELEVEITRDLYDRLEPYRSSGRDCLSLTVETGRWRIRRTKLPRKFIDAPFGLDRYDQCPPKQP